MSGLEYLLKHIRHSNLFAVLAIVLGLGCTEKIPEPQNSCYFIQNKYEQRVSWKSKLPVKFRVHKDIPKEARESITKAATEWNVISTKNVIEIVSWEAESNPSKSHADRVPTIFWKKDWEDDKASEQARTIIVWSDNVLKDADIWLNAKNFNFSYYGDDFDYTKIDLVSLMVHEFGHALGFAHTDSHKSIMYPRLARGFDRRSINHLEDLKAYSCEYGESMVKPSVMLAAIEVRASSGASSRPPEFSDEEENGSDNGEGEIAKNPGEEEGKSLENNAAQSSQMDK